MSLSLRSTLLDLDLIRCDASWGQARWLAWLEEEVKDKKKDVGECEAGDKLTEFRSLEQYYRWARFRRYGCNGIPG